MPIWENPPIIKIYEALGAVVDGRLAVSGNSGKCYSSSGNKYYDIEFDKSANAIMTNDNGSFWKGYLGYPAIAFLLKINELPYQENLAQLMKEIAWKDINQKHKNDFDKTLTEILTPRSNDERKELETYTNDVLEEITKRQYKLLGQKTKPPSGY